MVERVRELGVRDARVLEALRIVPRHLFVDEALASRAYEDTALPIGHGQTISQPYIVARTAELALKTCLMRAPRACSRSVPVAVMQLRCSRNYSVKSSASSVYVRCMNVRAKPAAAALVQCAADIWRRRAVAAAAPYHCIVAAAAADEIPPAWIEQLEVGGRIVAPVGTWNQHLTIAIKDADGRVKSRKEPVRFVPLRGGVA